MTRRDVLGIAAGAALVGAKRGFGQPSDPATEHDVPPIQQGPYSSSVDSFKTAQMAEWFRDAKFGMWAHWGPSSAIEDGDWYARNMYMEGSPQYQYHLKTYGHPSKFGYKDTIPLWKAERFDPKALTRLYACRTKIESSYSHQSRKILIGGISENPDGMFAQLDWGRAW